jgi:hypothetical protein
MRVSCGFRQRYAARPTPVNKLDFASKPKLTEDALPATAHPHNFEVQLWRKPLSSFLVMVMPYLILWHSSVGYEHVP